MGSLHFFESLPRSFICCLFRWKAYFRPTTFFKIDLIYYLRSFTRNSLACKNVAPLIMNTWVTCCCCCHRCNLIFSLIEFVDLTFLCVSICVSNIIGCSLCLIFHWTVFWIDCPNTNYSERLVSFSDSSSQCRQLFFFLSRHSLNLRFYSVSHCLRMPMCRQPNQM